MSTSGSSGNPVQTGKMSDRHDSSIYHPLRDDCFDRIDTPSMAEDGISINDYDDDASIFTANSFIDQQGSPSKGFCRSDKSDLLKLVYGDANKLSPGDDEDDEDFNEESQCLNPKQKNKIASKSVGLLYSCLSCSVAPSVTNECRVDFFPLRTEKEQ